MRSRYIPLLLILCVPVAATLRADDPNAGLPGAYLRAGWGARAGALGDAFVAAAEGPDALYWNPAGMALGRGPSVQSNFEWLSLGRSFNTAGLVWARDAAAPPPGGTFADSMRSGFGALGFGWVDESLGTDFEGRTGDTADFSAFGVRNEAYILGYARALLPWFSAGISGKAYQQVIATDSSQGFGADLGALILVGPRWRLGLGLQDVGAKVQWTTGYQESFPAILRAGVYGNLWKEKLFMTAQVRSVEYGGVDGGCGIEFRLLKYIAMQGGIQAHGWTFGGGLRLPVGNFQISADYAYLPDPLQQGPDQRFGVLINF